MESQLWQLTKMVILNSSLRPEWALSYPYPILPLFSPILPYFTQVYLYFTPVYLDFPQVTLVYPQFTLILPHFTLILPLLAPFSPLSRSKFYRIYLETLHTSLSRCNRLRDVDLAAVSLIEPSSGAYVELNELSSKFNSSILILQTDDSSYKKSTNQHSFSRKIQVQKMKCSQCKASQWFRRPKYCRLIYSFYN